MRQPVIIRSLLFAPANEPRKVARLGTAGADAVVLDLEDAVAKEEKVGARGSAREALGRLAPSDGPLRCVRVNALDTGLTSGDIAGVVCAELDALVVPKLESAGDLRRIDGMIDAAEAAAGVEAGRVMVLGLVETCRGLVRSDQIAGASDRLAAIVFGSGDLGNDLGIPTLRGDLSGALAFGRGKLVYDARAAGLPGPIDGPHLAFRDLAALEADCREARGLGYRGKVCVHPDQVPVVNRVFGPDREETEFAQRVIQAFREAESRGSASISVDGYFVDYPIVEKAERIVTYAQAISALEARTPPERPQQDSKGRAS